MLIGPNQLTILSHLGLALAAAQDVALRRLDLEHPRAHEAEL